MYIYKFFILSLLLGFVYFQPVSAKKIKNTFIISKETRKSEKPFEGTQISLSDSVTSVDKLKRISFVGYEKEPNSTRESFILVNPTDENIIGFEVKIDYLDMQGRMFHSQIIKKECSVPHGESRKFDFPSWDSQRTYYYYLGNEPKKVATPFQVKFHPLSFWIR